MALFLKMRCGWNNFFVDDITIWFYILKFFKEQLILVLLLYHDNMNFFHQLNSFYSHWLLLPFYYIEHIYIYILCQLTKLIVILTNSIWSLKMSLKTLYKTSDFIKNYEILRYNFNISRNLFTIWLLRHVQCNITLFFR